MRHDNARVNLWIFGVFVGIALTFNTPVYGQSYTPGQPVIATGADSTTTDAIFWDAAQFSGSDICAQIYAAWTAAMATGVNSATIDARGISGSQTCAASPFPGGASGRLLLGNTLITTSVTWQIPPDTIVEGLGVSQVTSPARNTTLRAGSSAADPVLRLGINQHSTFAAQVKNLSVDAYGIVTTGILNNSSWEGSRIEDVSIMNATLYGLLLGQYNAQLTAAGSGPYHNISVDYNSNCPTCGLNTTGIGIMTTSATSNYPVRGLDNVTVSGAGTNGRKIGTCIAVVGFEVQITNSHVEFCGTGIQIGSQTGPPTVLVEIQNVSSATGGGWGVTITNASDIMLTGMLFSGPEDLRDNVTNNLIENSNTIGLYLLGDGPNPAVISTTAGQEKGPLTWVAPANLDVVGNLSKASGTFKIDDPLDPANKYLYHSFVESPDMMNVYNGSVTTDKRGRAVVSLPDYFEKLNRDFRYQLTVIGSFAQATVAKEIQNNQFTIRTSKPGVKVSWQVTGVRQDAYAKAHPTKVEEEKPPQERGRYLHPSAF